MKGDWQALPGRTIEAVVVQESDLQPKAKVILVFSDGTYFEIYSNERDLRGTNRVHEGDLWRVMQHYDRGDTTVYRDEG
ncbi:MAG: hypothetical protein ABI542_00745 [Gemmatimonadota bacterium]